MTITKLAMLPMECDVSARCWCTGWVAHPMMPQCCRFRMACIVCWAHALITLSALTTSHRFCRNTSLWSSRGNIFSQTSNIIQKLIYLHVLCELWLLFCQNVRIIFFVFLLQSKIVVLVFIRHVLVCVPDPEFGCFSLTVSFFFFS